MWAEEPVLIINAVGVIDKWIKEVKTEPLDKRDIPPIEWLDLFASVSSLMSIAKSQEVVSQDEKSPSEYQKSSEQYIAWKFGESVGEFLLHNAKMPNATIAWIFGESEDLEPNISRSDSEISDALSAICSLVVEYDTKRDWRHFRDYSLSMWFNPEERYSQLRASQATPDSDVYWAMRIGFADVMLRKTKSVSEAIQTLPLIKTDRDELIKSLKDDGLIIVTPPEAIGKLHDRDQITKSLAQMLPGTFDKLTGEVVDSLIDGEIVFQMESETRRGIIDFYEAVEKCLKAYLLHRLDSFTQGSLMMQWSGETNKRLPSNLSPGEWGRLFDDITISNPNSKQAYLIYFNIIKKFINDKSLNLNNGEFRKLGQDLISVQDLRNRAKKNDPRSHAEERSELKKLRDLVLIGDNQNPPVISQIFQMFGSIK
jgi:hypothetical protein